MVPAVLPEGSFVPAAGTSGSSCMACVGDPRDPQSDDPTTPRSAGHTKRLILNCTVVDVEASKSDVASIVVDRGKITHVGKAERPETSDYEIIDGTGLHALPGLIDLHQHIGGDPDPNAINYLGIGDDEASFLEISRKNLNVAASAGVTAIRDTGSYLGRGATFRGKLSSSVNPILFSCGRVITYPGGHGREYGIEVQDEPAIKAAVREMVENGADFIKVASDPEDSEAVHGDINRAFSVADLEMIVREAKSHNLKVACHTFPSREGVERALAAGVDTLEHAVPFSRSLAKKMINEGVIIVPTLVAAADEFLPETLEEMFGISERLWRRLGEINYPPGQLRQRDPLIPPSIATWMERLAQYLPLAIEAGVMIGIGTDAGCRGTNSKSAVREMLLLAACGASNGEVIKYATVNGAQGLGRPDIGIIGPSKKANILFTRGDPLADLMTLVDPVAVLCNGDWVSSLESRVRPSS
jgi:imidazolonepropionase-like amidohydrolase